MSKQIYIDSNGNEIQVSGTVNTADMMPMSGNDSTKVSEAIGDLSQLTTSVTSSLVEAVNEVASYTPVYGNTTSGAIATFDTSLALPLQDCTIAINAVQESGTPSPDNVRPITGFSSVNVSVSGIYIWDEQWELGSYNSSADTVIKIVDTIHIRSKNPIRVVPNHTYYMNSAGKNVHLIVADANGNVLYRTTSLNNGTFTTPADSAFVYFNMAQAYGTTYNNDISINYQSSDTQYHAYNGNTYTNPLGQTVYGGSLDVTSGVLTVTHRYGLMQSDAPSFIESITTNFTTYYTKLSNLYPDIKATGYVDVISDKFVGVKTSAGNDTNIVYIQNGYANFRVNNGDFASAADFKTWIQTNGIELVYKLDTPVTYQLTPTQISAIVGTNNVFTDTNGNTSVVYACSLKDYIDSQ